MTRISVLIPTAGQPELLRCALQSIERQTVADQITEVLVAENLGDPRSRDTCRAFPRLPIEYVLRDPPEAPTSSFAKLFQAAKGELVAFVCDDDWWAPGHLQAAMRQLDEHGQAIARFSSPLFFVTEMPPSGWVSRPAALWLAAGRPALTEPWLLSPEQVLLASVLGTPFHISSMVVRGPVIVEVAAKLFGVPFYQIDRILFSQLAAKGSIVYDPNPDTFVRWRPDNVTNKMDLSVRDKTFREVTAQVIDDCSGHGVAALATWQRLVETVDAGVAAELCSNFRRAMDDRALRAAGFERYVERSRDRIIKKAIALGKSSLGRIIA